MQAHWELSLDINGRVANCPASSTERNAAVSASITTSDRIEE